MRSDPTLQGRQALNEPETVSYQSPRCRQFFFPFSFPLAKTGLHLCLGQRGRGKQVCRPSLLAYGFCSLRKNASCFSCSGSCCLSLGLHHQKRFSLDSVPTTSIFHKHPMEVRKEPASGCKLLLASVAPSVPYLLCLAWSNSNPS